MTGQANDRSARATLDGEPWRRRDSIVLASFVVCAAASLFWLVHPWFDASNDAAMYLACARSLLEGNGYMFLDEPFRVRPPGFSVLITPVLALRGMDFQALNLYVAAWGVACSALCFVWMRRRTSTWIALAISTALWFNPTFASLRNQIMSDVPGTALVFACLLLERWCARKPTLARDAVLALALGLSLYVRSIVVVLVVAIALARLASARQAGVPFSRVLLARVLPVVALTALVQLPWMVRDVLHRPATPTDQTALYGYPTGMWHADHGDPDSPRVPLGEVLARVPRNTESTLVALGNRLQPGEPSAGNFVLGALFLVALVAQAVRRRGAAELFACGVVLVVVTYFDFEARLLLPVMILAWAASAEWLAELGRRCAGERGALLPVVAACALLVADFAPRKNWEDVRISHEVCSRWAARANELLPRDARVAVPMEQWRWTIWLERPVWTLFFGWNRARGPAGAEAVLERHAIDVVLVTPFTSSDAAMRPWLRERFETVCDFPDVAIFRVRPARAGAERGTSTPGGR